MKEDQGFFERRIIIGLIVSTEYIERIRKFWRPDLLQSSEFKIVANWCLNYFDQYARAPDEDIQNIYIEELKWGNLSKADSQFLEEMLASLSDEYGRGSQFNASYLYDRTIKYFKSRELERHSEEVTFLMESGRVEEAEKLAQSFTTTLFDDIEIGLDLSSKEAIKRVERAFDDTSQKVLSYPGALGDMWNDHLIRGGFFTLLAPEKRGKTFMLLEMALRAIRQRANVAFFEAGDMTESQMLKRICMYISRKSDKEKYSKQRFRPVGDCIYNQLDLCTRKDRNCDHGIFEGLPLQDFLQTSHDYITIENLREKFEEFPDYSPCDSYSCKQRKGAVWIEKMESVSLLTSNHAKKSLRRFFKRHKRRFKLITHPAGTLTVTEMKRCLDEWERHDGFVPDIIVIDYADLLSASDGESREFRHKQDHIWKSLRGLSQERHALVLTATQADADSYTKGRLSLSNFSEDKRKLSHVTAQYGLNQDPKGREKKLGIMRINEIVVREGEFSPDNEVVILQDLAIGRPFLESFS